MQRDLCRDLRRQIYVRKMRDEGCLIGGMKVGIYKVKKNKCRL